MITMITMCYGKVREQLCSWFKNKNKETRHKQLSPVVKWDILLAHQSTQTSSIHRPCRSITTSLDFLLCFLQNQLICLRSLLLKCKHMSFFLGRMIPRECTHEDLIFDWILLFGHRTCKSLPRSCIHFFLSSCSACKSSIMGWPVVTHYGTKPYSQYGDRNRSLC